MRVAWSERTPVQASSIPTRPVLSSMTLPCWTASVPMRFRIRIVIAVSARMSNCTTVCSSCIGQGVATRKNKTGKAKCLNHGAPPARCSAQSEMTTATSDIVQLISRQSGFATAIRRTGNKMAAANSANTCR